MMLRDKIGLMLFSCFLAYSNCLVAQSDTILAETWVIESRDGNEFTGAILSEDQEAVSLRTSVYGDIRIPVDQIKSRTLLLPGS